MPASPRGDLSPRMIPRTSQTERVRSRVQRRRTERTSSPRPSTSRVNSTTRRSTKKRRKTTRKRKTTKKSEKNSGRKSSSSGKVGKRRKKKQRIQRRIKVMLRRDHVKSVKERLADTLGIILPRREDPSNLIVPPPRLNRTEASLSLQRSLAGIPSLSVFGSRDAIDYFPSGSDDEMGGGELGVISRRQRMSRSSVASVLRQKRQLAPAPLRIEPPTQGPLDLLGSLLETQAAFLAKDPSKKIEIKRDGSLVHKLPKLERTGPPSVRVQERRAEEPRLDRERDRPDVSSVVKAKEENSDRIDVKSGAAPVKESHGGHGGGRGGYNNAPPRGPSPNRNPAPQNFNFSRDWNVGSRGPLGFGPGRGTGPMGMNARMPLEGDSPVRPPFGRGRGRGDERPRKNSGSDRDGPERGPGDRPRNESDLFERRPAEPFDRRPAEPFDRRPAESRSRLDESETSLWGRRDIGDSSRPDPENRPRSDFLGGRPLFDSPGEFGRQDRRPDGPRPLFDEMLGSRRPFGSEGPRSLFSEGPRPSADKSEPPKHRLNGSESEPKSGNDSELNSSRPGSVREFEGRLHGSDAEFDHGLGRGPERPMRPGPNFGFRPRLGPDFDLRPSRPGSDFNPRMVRPGSDLNLGLNRPGSDFEPRSLHPGSELEPRGIRPSGFDLRPVRPTSDFERPLRPSGIGFDGASRPMFEPRSGGILNRMPHAGQQNAESSASEPQGQRLLLPPRPDPGQRPGFLPRAPSSLHRLEVSPQRPPGPVNIPLSPQRPPGPVNIPLSPQRPIRPPNRPQGLMDLVIERPPDESPSSSSQSEFPRFLDPSKPPDVVNEKPSFVSRPPFFERPPDLVQAPIVTYDDENEERTANNQQEASNFEGADYQGNISQQSNFGPNGFQPQNFGQPPPFMGFPGGMPPPTIQSPYGLPLPALPVRYDTASQPDLIPQMPQFFNSNQSAPPLFPSAATIQAAENPRADYYDPTEALDDDVTDIPVPAQEAVDIPLPNVDIPLPEQDNIPLPIDVSAEPEDEIPIPETGIPMPEPKTSLDAERRSSLNAVASALSATTRRTGTIQINLKSQQAKQEELVNTISRLAKASLESIVAEMKSKEAEQSARESGEEKEDEEKHEELSSELPFETPEEQDEIVPESPEASEEPTLPAAPAIVDIFENPEENVPSLTETEEESRKRKIRENLSLLAVKETRKIDSPIFDDERDRKEKAKRKKERQLAKEKSAAASPADTPVPASAEETITSTADVTAERVLTLAPASTSSKDQPEPPSETTQPAEKERGTPNSDDSWVEKSDERKHRGKSRERGKERRGDKSRRDKDKERRSRRGRSRSPRKRDKRKKRSKEKRKERHKKREKKAESDITLSEPELEGVDASPVSSGEFPRPESQGSVENISDSSLNLVSDAEDGEIPVQLAEKAAVVEKPQSTEPAKPRGDFEEGEISDESPERQRKPDLAGNSPDRRKVVELSPGRRKRLEAIAMAVSPDLRTRLEKGNAPPENAPEIHFAEKIAPQGDVTDVEWRKFTKKTRSYREVTLGSVNKEKEESPQKQSSPVRRKSRSKSRDNSRVVQREVSPSRDERTVSRAQPEAERGRKDSSERLVYRRSKSPRENSRSRRSLSPDKRRASPSRDKRARSASKERRVERKRSPERKRRSLSREKKRSPDRRRRSHSRKRSHDRSRKRKSVSKSPKRRKSRSASRDRSPKRRKSRSPVKRGRSVDKKRRRSKSPARRRSKSKSPVRRRSKSKSPVRRRTKSKSLSPARREELVSRSHSRSPKKRRTSRSRKRRRSREKKRGNKRSPSVSGDSSSSPGRKEKRKKKRDDKKKTKKKAKEDETAPRKEVVASGDNIRVSVNFGQKGPLRPAAIRGRPMARGGKRRKIQLKPKGPPVMIDLIEGTETTLDSRPPEVVLLDSDSEKNKEQPLGPLDTEPLTDSPVESPAHSIENAPELVEVAEKVPTPQPVVQQKIRIKIREEPPRVDASKDMFFDEEPVVAPSRGPVTPPEPSPKKDEYDPCDPTESPDNQDKSQDLYSPPASPAEDLPSPDVEPSQVPQETIKEPSPPSPKKATPEIRTKSPESLKATAVVTPLPPSKPAQTVVQLQKPDLSQPPPTMQPQTLLQPAIGSMVPRSFVPHQLLAAAVMAQAQQQVQVPMPRPPGILLPHQSVPPHLLFNLPTLQRPEAPNFFGPPPVLQQPPPAQHHETAVAGGSPGSPDSSELSDLFEPPADTKKPKKGPKSPPPPSTSKSKPPALKKKLSAPMQVDDVPSSAMELQALIKLTRQEQIVEQVKMVLKPHYRKKKINKEEYKDIMKRAVGKITHSRASSINPAKVEALVTGYVKKIIHERKKT